jgi:MFS family permease
MRSMIRIAILLFTFITAIDITIVATITPHIIASLGDMELYPLMSSAYIMAFFLTTPIFGKVADHYGCKKAAFFAVSSFLLGSLLCGLATSMKQLIIFRLIEGVGARGLTNICSITIGRLYTSDKKRSFMQAVLSLVWVAAGIIGPLLGAFLTDVWSWRLVFLINIPIGLIATIALGSFKEEHRKLDEKFDISGTLLFILSVSLIFLGFANALTACYSLLQLIMIAIGGALFIAFVNQTRRATSPLIPFHLLKKHVVAACIVLGIISGACLTILYTLISLYIQGALRESIQTAGFMITAISIGWSVGAFGCSFLLNRIGIQKITLTTMLVLITGFALLSKATLADPRYYFILTTFVIGMGIGAVINITVIGVQSAVEPKFLGRATSFLSLVRSGGGSIGAVCAGFLQLYYFRSSLATNLLPRDIVVKLSESPELFLKQSIETALSVKEFAIVRQLFAESIERVFALPVLFLLCALPLSFVLSKKNDK